MYECIVYVYVRVQSMLYIVGPLVMAAEQSCDVVLGLQVHIMQTTHSYVTGDRYVDQKVWIM
jgi:hypothetical protein